MLDTILRATSKAHIDIVFLRALGSISGKASKEILKSKDGDAAEIMMGLGAYRRKEEIDKRTCESTTTVGSRRGKKLRAIPPHTNKITSWIYI